MQQRDADPMPHALAPSCFKLGRFSWVANVARLKFIAVMSVLFVRPTARPVTTVNMNYAGVTIGRVGGACAVGRVGREGV